MSINATTNPSSGPTPGTFTLTVTGAKGTVVVTAEPSPPNPSPMPGFVITVLGNNQFEIEITGSVGTGVELYFAATDAGKQRDTDSYTST